MAWLRVQSKEYTHIIAPSFLVDRGSLTATVPTAGTRNEGANSLNSAVGSLSAASTRRQWQSQLPHQSFKRLGALEFSVARMKLPANTSATRQVTGECNWQTSRVKLVLAAFESGSEAPR